MSNLKPKLVKSVKKEKPVSIPKTKSLEKKKSQKKEHQRNNKRRNNENVVRKFK
jgi:hypothetical protein